MSSESNNPTDTNETTSVNVLNTTQKIPDILDQLSSYNKDDTETLISTLNIEYQEQKQLNSMLQSKDIKSDIRVIKTFISENIDTITNQVDTISKLKSDLIDIIKENEELKTEQEELQELLTSSNSIHIAKKLRELKAIKQSIKHFLFKQGIVSE